MNEPTVLNPIDRFPTHSLTRSDIALELNNFLNELEDDEVNGDEPAHGVPEFQPGDSRLTDDVCQQFARRYGEIHMSHVSEDRQWLMDVKHCTEVLNAMGYELSDSTYEQHGDGDEAEEDKPRVADRYFVAGPAAGTAEDTLYQLCKITDMSLTVGDAYDSDAYAVIDQVGSEAEVQEMLQKAGIQKEIPRI